jgi:hypothetical protein
VVVFGGLAGTIIICIVFSPAVFLRFGRKAVERLSREGEEKTGLEDFAAAERATGGH